MRPRWRQHLRAETNAEERLTFLERHFDPVDLAPQPIVFVIDAHRATENDGARMIRKARRQWIAITRTANVEFEPLRAQKHAKTAGRGMFLMQDDGDPARLNPLGHASA